MPTSTTSAKRRLITAISLASISILGLGAAITSAAWTDDAWFAAEASTSSVDLLGAVSETQPALSAAAAWQDADSQATSIIVPATAFEGIDPAETRAVSIWLWNSSTTDLSVSLPSLALTGDPLFDPSVTAPSAPATIGVFTDAAGTTPYATTTVVAGATLQLYVVVRTPNWTSPADDAMQSVASNEVDIPFTGTTTP